MRDFLGGPDLLRDVAGQYRRTTPAGLYLGEAAIITAGVPGAGKSSAAAELSPTHRRIDPDEIRDILLSRLELAGLLDIRHKYPLADESS